MYECDSMCVRERGCLQFPVSVAAFEQLNYICFCTLHAFFNWHCLGFCHPVSEGVSIFVFVNGNQVP